MTEYREREEYLNRLRKVVIHSADVLPQEVATYIKETTRCRRWGESNLLLKDYRPLVDHIAGQYIDLLIEMLIGRSDACEESDEDGFEDRTDLGFPDNYDLFPPAHVQGPFLYALRKNENEGLRLVHTLSNFAAGRWRRRTRAGFHSVGGTIALPVTIDLSTGPREFWGDSEVFYWFRPRNCGPDVVTCALMALEVWMEEQMEQGRDPNELFQRVLAESSCVAVLGLCLGIALANPSTCLRAVLPIASSPAVWKMDIKRFSGDRRKPLDYDPLGRNTVINGLVAERDKRPQRFIEVRHLPIEYLFGKDPALKAQFKQAISRFTERLPFCSVEEQRDPTVVNSLRESMESFQAFGDEANYYYVRGMDGVQIVFKAPQSIQERDAPIVAALAEKGSWFSLDVWAQKTIQEGKVADGMSLSAAVELAKRFQRDDDFSTPHEIDADLNVVRLQGIAGVACAALITDIGWCKKQGLIPWARGILVAAAHTPVARHSLWADRHSAFPSEPKVSAALGLASLVGACPASLKIRKEILRLVGDPQLQVVEAVFRGLHRAFDHDRVLFWNALSLALSLTVVPRGRGAGWNELSETERNRELIETYVGNLKSEYLPTLPTIRTGEKEVFLWDFAWRAIQAIPFAEVTKDPLLRAQLIQLGDDLLAWTIRKNMPLEDSMHRHEPGPYHWNNAFLGWLSEFAAYLSPEECRHHILDPIRETWPRAPRLTGDLLDGYISFRIGFMEPPSARAQNEWREICNWVLDSRALADLANYDYLESGISDAVSRIVYTAYGHSLLKEDWPPATLFSDITEKWVNVVGGNPDAFNCLIIFLNGPGWQFAPEPALEWLFAVFGPLDDPNRIWHKHSNGESTAEFLQRIVKNFAPQLQQNPGSLRRFSYLIDRLVESGVPLAGLIQTQLEEHPNS